MKKFWHITNYFKDLTKFNILTFVTLIFLILAGIFSGQNSIPPIDRDEARFAQASRQMVQSNDYVNVKFQDEIRAKKPIGIYWLQAFSTKVFGSGGAIPPLTDAISTSNPASINCKEISME